jgi:hypothetical protein
LGPSGEIQKFKVRIVAGGHKQVRGINYEEAFAAAAKIASIRVILAYAAQRDWDIDQIDVVGAYLNADLDKEVYMGAPHGMLKLNQLVYQFVSCYPLTFLHLDSQLPRHSQTSVELPAHVFILKMQRGASSVQKSSPAI